MNNAGGFREIRRRNLPSRDVPHSMAMEYADTGRVESAIDRFENLESLAQCRPGRGNPG